MFYFGGPWSEVFPLIFFFFFLGDAHLTLVCVQQKPERRDEEDEAVLEEEEEKSVNGRCFCLEPTATRSEVKVKLRGQP